MVSNILGSWTAQSGTPQPSSSPWELLPVYCGWKLVVENAVIVMDLTFSKPLDCSCLLIIITIIEYMPKKEQEKVYCGMIPNWMIHETKLEIASLVTIIIKARNMWPAIIMWPAIWKPTICKKIWFCRMGFGCRHNFFFSNFFFLSFYESMIFSLFIHNFPLQYNVI